MIHLRDHQGHGRCHLIRAGAHGLHVKHRPGVVDRPPTAVVRQTHRIAVLEPGSDQGGVLRNRRGPGGRTAHHLADDPGGPDQAAGGVLEGVGVRLVGARKDHAHLLVVKAFKMGQVVTEADQISRPRPGDQPIAGAGLRISCQTFNGAHSFLRATVQLRSVRIHGLGGAESILALGDQHIVAPDRPDEGDFRKAYSGHRNPRKLWR